MTIVKNKFENIKIKDKWLLLRSESLRIFNDLKKDEMTNLEILNDYKIIHAFNSKEYPFLPNDNETKFLLFSSMYNDAP